MSIGEVQRFKLLVADLSLDKRMLQDLLFIKLCGLLCFATGDGVGILLRG